jgi:hypothetical protein
MIFENKTKCPLCGEVLSSKDELEMFPHFVGNVKDSLFIFSDTAVHLSCLNKHPLRDMVLFFKNKYNSYLPLKNSKCIIDGELIKEPRDIIFFGLLTSNENEELFKFNFLLLNKKNISKWHDKDKFITTANNFNQQGKWGNLTEFNLLDFLIKELQ